MLKHIKNSLTALLTAPARYAFWLPSGSKLAPRLFMYHSVTNERAPDGLTVSPHDFDWQLADLVKRGYRFITAGELAAAINNGQTHFEKTAIITFDDGYDDNYYQAFPILKKYQARATIYLSPAYKEISFLKPEHIREMSESGLIEFGAHTYNHINLLKADTVTAETEIIESKNAAESLSGQKCLSFAYPYGRYNENHVALLKKHGFSNAVTTKKRLRLMSQPQLYTLPRLSVDGRMNRLQWRIMLAKGRYKL